MSSLAGKELTLHISGFTAPIYQSRLWSAESLGTVLILVHLFNNLFIKIEHMGGPHCKKTLQGLQPRKAQNQSAQLQRLARISIFCVQRV